MQRGTTVADPELPVKLKDQELLDRGQHLAEMISQRAALVAAKASENKKRQGEIDEMDDEIARLARVISEGFENRSQMDLFSDQLSPDESKRRLAEVAARAAKHPFVANETLIDACSRRGCGAQATADVHVPPVPSEPHTFVPDGSRDGKCWACESGKDDPIHAAPAPDLPAVVDTDTTPGDTPPAESVAIARDHVVGDGSGEALPEMDSENPERTADPAFDFTGNEQPDAIIRIHAAIETEEHGGEA
jgi:hypothetical protein